VVAAALGAPLTQLLTRENVLVWKALVIPALWGACVLHLVEGRDHAPVEILDVFKFGVNGYTQKPLFKSCISNYILHYLNWL
jgi:hypothetical protein